MMQIVKNQGGIIQTITEIQGRNIDWQAFGERVKEIRIQKGLTIEDAAYFLELSLLSYDNLEKGKENRKCANMVWKIQQTWDLSLNWLLNGIGNPYGEDPLELLPETLIVDKGAGIRRTESRADAENGFFTDPMMEFIVAIDKFKKANNLIYATMSQVYEIFLALGYRKIAPSRIAPLGYLVEQQKQHELQNQQNEKIPITRRKAAS